jgi:hypothetical protein
MNRRGYQRVKKGSKGTVGESGRGTRNLDFFLKLRFAFYAHLADSLARLARSPGAEVSDFPFGGGVLARLGTSFGVELSGFYLKRGLLENTSASWNCRKHHNLHRIVLELGAWDGDTGRFVGIDDGDENVAMTSY